MVTESAFLYFVLLTLLMMVLNALLASNRPHADRYVCANQDRFATPVRFLPAKVAWRKCTWMGTSSALKQLTQKCGTTFCSRVGQ
jgi:hypothetical protein